jgi:hypothetical protein
MAAQRPPVQLDQISSSIGALETHVEIIRENLAAQHRQTTEILQKLDDVHTKASTVESIRRDLEGIKPVIAKMERIEQRVIGAVGLATFIGAGVMALFMKLETIVKWFRSSSA